MSIWNARLLNQESSSTTSSSPIDDLEFVIADKTKEESVFQAMDYQCQEIGKIAYVSTVTPNLIPIRRAVQQAIDELVFFERVIKKVEKKASRDETSMSEKKFEGILYRAKSEMKNAQRYAQHCRVVLGRECVNSSFCPPGANKFFDEASRLMGQLKG